MRRSLRSRSSRDCKRGWGAGGRALDVRGQETRSICEVQNREWERHADRPIGAALRSYLGVGCEWPEWLRLPRIPVGAPTAGGGVKRGTPPPRQESIGTL